MTADVSQLLFAGLSGLGDTIGNYRERSRLKDLGTGIGADLGNDNYKGAASRLFQMGDVKTGLELLQLGQQREADTQAQGLLSGLGTSTQKLPSLSSMPSAGMSGPNNYYDRTAQIETGGNPNQTSPTGAQGKYQFTRGTWARYGGGGDINGDQTGPMQALTTDNNNTLSSILGRPATAGELYLAHQQGAKGALALLSNPNARAGDLVGNRAIAVNGGNPNAPASDFIEKWTSKFQGVPSPFGQQTEQPNTQLAGAVPTPDTSQAAPDLQSLQSLQTERIRLANGLASRNLSTSVRDAIHARIKSITDEIGRQQELADRASKQAYDQARPLRDMAERKRAADEYGLTGEDRKIYMLNGKVPTQAEKPLTESQANAGIYADRMREAEKVISSPESAQAGTSWKQQGLASLPVVGNALISEDRGLFDQAKRDFVNAVLRKESGAAINQSEFDNAERQYFPQPGDTPKRLEQKRQNRETAITAISRAAGPHYKPPAPVEPGVTIIDGYRIKRRN